MFEIRRPKIGLAGVMSRSYRGNKESFFASDHEAIADLSTKLMFDLKVIEKGIYDQAQAKKAASELAEWGADFVLLQTSSFASGDFLYPFTEIPALMGLWAVPEGNPGPGGGLPLNSFSAANMYNSIIALHLKGYSKPVKWFFGRARTFDFVERLGVTAAALRAFVNLSGSRIALIGGVAPGFDNLIVDVELIRQKLGVEVLELDIEQILAGAEKVNSNLVSKTVREIRATAATFDHSQSNALEKTARVFQSVMAVAEEKKLDGIAMSCWPQFQSDYGLAVCSVMGHLNTHGAIAACEGDVISAISMLLLRWLSNGDPVTQMELVSIDHADQSILLWKCGPTSPALANERGMHLQSLWLFDGPQGQRTGLHNDLVLKPGPGTIIGLMPDLEKMLVLEGGIDSDKPSYTGSRGWLKNLCLNLETISTQDLVQTIMSSGFQHHYPFGYGSQSAAALELGAWLGIEPIKKQTYSPYLKGYDAD